MLILVVAGEVMPSLVTRLSPHPDKKKEGGELGVESNVNVRHDDITAIIAKVKTQLCSHVIG